MIQSQMQIKLLKIYKEIKKRFPDHQIIGEEFGHKKTKSDFSWVIDPIDGTRSFVIIIQLGVI